MSIRQSAQVPAEVSEAIRNAREAKGWSRDQAAKEAGVSISLLAQVELGMQYKEDGRTPVRTTARTLYRIARALDLEPAPLLRSVGLNTPAQSPATGKHAAPMAVDQPRERVNTFDTTGLSPEKLSKAFNFIASRLPDREAVLLEGFLIALRQED